METNIQSIWSTSKLLIKALIIALLVLLLQIPTYYVKNLILEREQRQKDAIAEVNSRWAGPQNIAGPVIVLPYNRKGTDSVSMANPVKSYAYFLPDNLNIHSTIIPEEKHRGIYKVMVYTSSSELKGSFKKLPLEKLGVDPFSVFWDEAFLQLSIADSKGMNDDPKLVLNGKPFNVESVQSNDFSSDIMIPLQWMNGDSSSLEFDIQLNISGSDQLLFTPVGKTTTVSLQAEWPHPSFTGDVLPIQSDIKKDSFSAQWKSVSPKRNFPQQWKDQAFNIQMLRPVSNMNESVPGPSLLSNNITGAAFGVNLFVPVNGYQKTMRSVKYAVLCILLTFAAFFIIETTNKRAVHPFQYGLVGLALVLFYTLLLSFSEYTGFNIAYIIASVFTIGLIAWFVRGILGSPRLTIILSVVLFLLYTYVFTILQLQDFSLILGSIGLFITLAVIMHFSKKIQW